MNVRPIDLQVLIPRAAEVSKTQNIAERQPEFQQQQLAGEWKHISAERQTKIQSKPKTEGGKVIARQQAEQRQRHKDSGQDADSNGQDKRERTVSSREQPHSDPILGHTIDIKT